MSATSVVDQLSAQVCLFCALTAQVSLDDPVVEPVLDKTSGLPVSLVLLPVEFHAARVKFPMLSMVSPPNPAHQSPATDSVRLMTGNREADAKMARLSNGARSRINISKRPLKIRSLVSEEHWGTMVCGDEFQGEPHEVCTRLGIRQASTLTSR